MCLFLLLFFSYDVFDARCPPRWQHSVSIQRNERRRAERALLDREARRRNSESTRDSCGIERRALIRDSNRADRCRPKTVQRVAPTCLFFERAGKVFNVFSFISKKKEKKKGIHTRLNILIGLGTIKTFWEKLFGHVRKTRDGDEK